MHVSVLLHTYNPDMPGTYQVIRQYSYKTSTSQRTKQHHNQCTSTKTSTTASSWPEQYMLLDPVMGFTARQFPTDQHMGLNKPHTQLLLPAPIEICTCADMTAVAICPAALCGDGGQELHQAVQGHQAHGQGTHINRHRPHLHQGKSM